LAPTATNQQRILAIIPKEKVKEQKSLAKVTLVDPLSVGSPIISRDDIRPGWHLLDGQHLLDISENYRSVSVTS
jgi:hypothetical protein